MVRVLKAAVLKMAKRSTDFIIATNRSHPLLKNLIQSLQIGVDNLIKSREPLRDLRIGFGLTSRFCHEAQGYIDYYDKYLPRLDSPGCSKVDEGLVGVWTKDEEVCATYFRMGVPVWLLRHGSLVSHKSNKEYVEPRTYRQRPRCPDNCFRDDGYVDTCPPLFKERQNDVGKLLKEMDGWARTRLAAAYTQ